MSVAERFANRSRQLRRHTQHLVFVGCFIRRCRDHVAGHRLRRFHRYGVAVALAFHRTGEDHADALLDGDLCARYVIQLSGGRTPRLRLIPARSYALMKPAPSSAIFNDRLQRAVEGWVVARDSGSRRSHGQPDRAAPVSPVHARTTRCRQAEPGPARSPRRTAASPRRA